ncbi:hypothetical protein DDZ13_00410 [Coraliomargarita sinensis]|uniref:DUF374 domain-containing protein n=1 Tax=Coraliomargarita sinensis TaxID=2174842 RepID=A0A317ZK23_9BACT|nr:lysophospholipid acyltransferase family protein [Coraliomargarita sinensis]PXA05362.1 hypothetical protein DDZ13_00410 [Coraliomargarita sinensis]
MLPCVRSAASIKANRGIAKAAHSLILAASMSDPVNQSRPYAELKWHQRVLLSLLAFLMGLWSRSLRFHWGPEVQAVIDRPLPPSVVILWHNRLFAAPEFFRRNFGKRRLATLISASGDGAWLAAFVGKLGMFPIRGSHYKRGPQAVREMLAAHREGYDIAVTPDGSRGPMYDLKPGAIAVALKTGAPFVMFSLNFSRAWRLKSWDRFYLPVPFSRVEVQIKVIERPAELGEDPRQLADLLKEQMNTITQD